ncbi:NAD(P)-binding protein [Wallemia mellicola CBS 633.66]|uniref:NAD(P)-binding protein n=2 Tax=Wallemia mellicola TaxID=1708541 RepID=A0A4T0N8G8_9BASI|nr:NAD(P)-binding protein [Wallemia mellicola CBS 633.66]TIB74703.1 hypothetical protein E3Q24_00363 [Wallemia mellicola]EIM24236.1 NAD(P)-binding protein [Wallemia mellicola CBS 633.66]TIB79456.1 hypothetical protein E3Q23_00069 [Wallemia mellicola]TIB89512.1 NAD(P)-binding protein [Wallemia mellicola]TIB91946.1 NAD(P)-binding protein [Wallemia mellicola]|eukprot:XP_006956054.1 NAD(P)-binding protein [Wallemia mellicola CBS 633.66]
MLDCILSKVLPKSAYNFYTQSFPPASKWSTEDIPDLTGKTVIVTGATSGIGKDTARALMQHNADVYIGGRSDDKLNAAIDELKVQTGKTAKPFFVDLSDFESVKSAAEDFLKKETKLAILFNNAGVMVAPIDMFGKQGYDIQFQTNVMSHYLLTRLLFPALDNYSKTGETARVVHTSSLMQALTKHPRGIDFDVLRDGEKRRSNRKLDPWELYGYSKIGNTVISNILNEEQPNVSHSSCHPGGLQTELQRYVDFPAWKTAIFNLMLYPSHLGALTQLYLGTVTKDTKGIYGIPWAREGKADKRTDDPSLIKDLREWLHEELKAYLP